jgi:GTPase SAR1 family protein
MRNRPKALSDPVGLHQPNGKNFRVNIWDFGGQEIYHQTHQFFLTERSLYALVADTRTENTDFTGGSRSSNS